MMPWKVKIQRTFISCWKIRFGEHKAFGKARPEFCERTRGLVKMHNKLSKSSTPFCLSRNSFFVHIIWSWDRLHQPEQMVWSFTITFIISFLFFIQNSASKYLIYNVLIPFYLFNLIHLYAIYMHIKSNQLILYVYNVRE